MDKNQLPQMPPMQSVSGVAEAASVVKTSPKVSEPSKEVDAKLQERVKAALVRGVPQEVVDAFLTSKDGKVKVRATTKGIYPNCIRRKRGDEFKIAQLEDFSTTWHELVK